MGFGFIGGGGGGAGVTTAFKQGISPSGVIPTTRVTAGNFIGVRVRIPTDTELKMWAGGLQDTNQTVPTGVTLQFRTGLGGTPTNQVSISQKYQEGDPLASVLGPGDAIFRINNADASDHDMSAFWSATLEGV